MVERRHGGVGPLEELWHPKQLTCAGMEAEEAVGTRTKKKRTKSGNDLGVSRTWNLTHVWQHTIFDAANAMRIPYLRCTSDRACWTTT